MTCHPIKPPSPARHLGRRFARALTFLLLGCALAGSLSAQTAVNSPPPGAHGIGNTQTTFAALTNAILFDGIWYNPAFFPPPPTVRISL